MGPMDSSVLRQLTTDRLMLRAHRVEDFEDCVALWSDPVVNRHLGSRAASREETWSRLLRYLGLWPALGYGYWVIADRSSGRFLGEVGLADFRRDIEPPLTGPEAGWAILPNASGRGIATEALAAVLDWADKHLHHAHTQCIITEQNLASIRVATKLGYQLAADAQYRGAPITLYQRPRGS